MKHLQPLTRNDILNLAQVGARFRETFDTVDGVPTPNSRWHEREVVSVIAQRDDVSGLAFTVAYANLGACRQVSFSAKEGDVRIQPC